MAPVLLLLLTLSPSPARAAAGLVKSDWTYVAARMTRAGLPRDFVAACRTVYEPRFLTRVTELNVLLFLRRQDDHGPQANDDGAARVRAFLDDHAALFGRVERAYGVDPATIAGLLYIESRFGRNVGHFHVPSVFLNLVQADRPEMIAHLRRAAPGFRPKITAHHRREIARRAAKKARWALTELAALARVWRRDPAALASLRGSFAGAIGMPQFLPSSLLAYARAARPGPSIDLARVDDAVTSVANYLRRSGWRADRPESHANALFKYNQSRDYGRAILKLAAAARRVTPRAPAAAR